MDLDGDKIDDLISGSYTGGVTFYKGLGQGKFETASQILPKNVKYDSGELALSPCGGDWDGDGDADLAVGQISGPVRLLINDGKGNFTRAGNFTSGGKEISAGDGGPCLTDWNNDSVLDLLLGDDEGNVLLYPGTKKGSLELGVGSAVLTQQKQGDGWKPTKRDPKSPTGLAAKRPGVRVKPFAADWNGDGKLDLLVGDFLQVAPPAKKLSATEQTKLKKLQTEMAQVQKVLSAAYQRAQERALKDVGAKSVQGLTPDQMKKWQDAYMKHYDAEMKALEAQNERAMVLQREIGKLVPPAEATGFVWVYLRK
ncbi:MAG TPA: FG-GAP-like repeat-containing protein [Fimbriimonadaceae bacterium]|nr:FG-GAP-like repeat-containing protein [Fimbriimonadaceae bacterium]